MVRHLKAVAWCILAVSFLSLAACSDSDSPPPPPPPQLSLTGTVSDSTQAPVNGATVTVYNSTTSALVTSTTTNVVGRYTFYGLPTSTALTFKVTGPAGTFPAQAEKVSLVAGVASVLDFYLPSSGSAATESSPGVWTSLEQIHGPLRASVSIPEFADPAFTGTPTVYVAPYDVSQIGDGFPVYSVSPMAVGVDEIIEYYAAAAFSVTGATFTSADLSLPIPLELDIAAFAAAGDLLSPPLLYRFDETTNAWVDTTILPTFVPADTTDPLNPIPQKFVATVTQPGYYRVGKVVPATSVTGTLTYSDGTTPAAGVTVYVSGSVLPDPNNAYGYQQLLVTDALGQYTALVKTGGNTAYTFTAWGFGLELSNTMDPVTTAAPVSYQLTFAKPAYGVPAAVALDNDFIMPNFDHSSIGLITASGRFTSDIDVIVGTSDGTGILTPGRADVSFTYNSFNINNDPLSYPQILSLNATTKGSGIQLVPGNFDSLGVAPSTGYADYSTFASISIPDAASFPAGGMVVVVEVIDYINNTRTKIGYAKIGIDSVAIDPLNLDNRVLKVRSAFSLTGSF